MILTYSVILLLYIAFCSVSIFARRTALAIYLYGLISTVTCFFYYTYNAADVALTEMSVGILLSFYLYFLVYSKYHVNSSEDRNFLLMFLIGIFCVGIFCILLYIGFLLDDLSLLQEYSLYYNTSSYNETRIANTVTAVLASYRSFDTLGETLIIAISSFGIPTILKRYK
jgi:multicomponent Na+:H+ antiporter subunit B